MTGRPAGVTVPPVRRRTRGRGRVVVLVGIVLASAACGGGSSAGGDAVSAAPGVASTAATTAVAPTSASPTSASATSVPAPTTTTAAAVTTTTAAPAPIPPCDDPPFPIGPAAVTAEGRDLAIVQRALFDLVRANRRVLSGTWWDGAAQELVLAAKDTARAPALLAAVDTGGVPVRVEAAALSYGELDDLGLTTIGRASSDLGVQGREVVRADLTIELTPVPADERGIEAYTEAVGADTRWFCWRI